MTGLSPIEGVLKLMKQHQYENAESVIQRLLDEGEHELLLFIQLARCQLALEKFEEALHSYNHLLHYAEELDVASGLEAALVLDQKERALQLCRLGEQSGKENAEFQFLAALAHYKNGNIKSTINSLTRALQLDLLWDDDDPIDFIGQQVLPKHEFHDFEQIYLDCHERVHEQTENPQNRWFSFNMPVWDLLKAGSSQRQGQRAIELASLLSPHFDPLFLNNGKNELGRIINDMSKNQENEIFVEKMRDMIRENRWSEAAGLILSLELENLAQFAPFFNLEQQEVKGANLQYLLNLLPMRLAVGLIYLYSVSHPDEKLANYDLVHLSDDLLAGLIATCFVSFYQQVNQYRAQDKKNKQTA